jgi:Copper type II ascorbate-dependent monooxygenase, N-terminal domain
VTGRGTLAIIRRKLNTKDCQDHPIVAGIAYPLIWAVGTPALSKHANANRGNALVTFIPAAAPVAVQAGKLQYDGSIDLSVNVSNIPTQLTSYYCKRFQLPSNTSHIVGYEADIDNKAMVHHIGEGVTACFKVYAS